MVFVRTIQGRRRLRSAQHHLVGGVADHTRYHAGFGPRSAEGLHVVHPVLGVALVLLIVAHAVLTVPARRIRLEVDERARRR